jgi:ketosteroid isomerase-like protein
MDVHEEAFDAVRRWWRAWVEGDVGTLERMADPDYVELTEMKQLRPLGVAQLCDEVSRYAGRVSITDWEVYDPATKVFERTVSCSYSFRISGERGGRRFSFRGRATDVLAKKNDRWMYVSHYGTLESREAGRPG